jgi:hypothetical protein
MRSPSLAGYEKFRVAPGRERRLPGVSIRRMADAKPKVLIEFDPGSEPLSGRVRNQQTGARRSFVGWLGLAHAIGRALEATPSRPTAPRAIKTTLERRAHR